MLLIKTENWQPCDGFTLEENALKAIVCRNNALVIAGPGAGKTELLAQKANYLFCTGLSTAHKKILAISFKKDSAVNLKERVVKRCGRECDSRFISMTYDAYFKSILDHFRLALPESYRPDKDYIIINGSNDEEALMNAFEKAGYKAADGMSKKQILTELRKKLDSVTLPLNPDRMEDKGWINLLKGDEKHSSGLTFRMITLLAIDIFRNNPKIRRAQCLTYSHVFLDEFQDTTSIQYLFIKENFVNAPTILTAVGDSKQRIMLWAGAKKSVFEDFCSDFNAERFQMMMNHRSAPRLVALQKQMYSMLNENDIPIKTSPKWKSDDGIINLFQSDNEIEEAKKVATWVSVRHSAGIEYNDMCILCKQTPEKYTEKIINELAEIGVRARIEMEYQNILKEPIVDLVIKILSLSLERKHSQEYSELVFILENLKGTSFDQSTNAYRDFIFGISEMLNRVKKVIQEKNIISDIVELVVAYLNVDDIKSFYPQYKQGTYMQDCIQNFIIMFTDELEIEKGNWLAAIDSFKGLHSIPIMTIHKSKGLEYSDVYFVGLEDAAFWAFKDQSDEDRCAFFVALSRAKSFVTFTYCGYRENLMYNKYSSHRNIQEFYDLLVQPGIAEVYE